MNDYASHRSMIDECPNCHNLTLEIIPEHDIVICFKCRWIINASSWSKSWAFQ